MIPRWKKGKEKICDAASHSMAYSCPASSTSTPAVDSVWPSLLRRLGYLFSISSIFRLCVSGMTSMAA
ncbi:hypothetical protein O3P69_015410 [Scylla paramamosain]|uniref:Uncharacterized protein n=1 Tax=Scylla paramamosain TaxID=85552 RepID=A0AAW0T4X8_SCYPA